MSMDKPFPFDETSEMPAQVSGNSGTSYVPPQTRKEIPNHTSADCEIPTGFSHHDGETMNWTPLPTKQPIPPLLLQAYRALKRGPTDSSTRWMEAIAAIEAEYPEAK
jgi:hypothetical protein